MKQARAQNMNFLIVNLAIVVCYLITHGLSEEIGHLLKFGWIPETSPFAQIISLAHGVRILSCWLFGWGAVLPLIGAAYIAHLLFDPCARLGSFGQFDATFIGAAAFTALSANLSLELLKYLGWNLRARESRRSRWLGVILAGAIAALMNGVGLTLLFYDRIPPDLIVEVFHIHVFGDILGMIFTLFGLAVIFRTLRRGPWRG